MNGGDDDDDVVVVDDHDWRLCNISTVGLGRHSASYRLTPRFLQLSRRQTPRSFSVQQHETCLFWAGKAHHSFGQFHPQIQKYSYVPSGSHQEFTRSIHQVAGTSPVNGDLQNDAPPRAGSLTKKPIKALRSAPLTSLHGIHGGLLHSY